MKTTEAFIACIAPRRAAILALAGKHHCHNVRLLAAAGLLGESSKEQFDFLVDVDEETTGLHLGGLVADLRDLLSLPVNVLTEAAIHPELRASLLADAVAL